MLKYLLVMALLAFTFAPAGAAPYAFVNELDEYTWGESLDEVRASLEDDPYSQDPTGLTYIVNAKWIKRIQATNEGRVYQVIDQLVYAKGSDGALTEYELLYKRLTEIYGQPTISGRDCLNPESESNCRLARWDQHPETQVIISYSDGQSSSSVVLALNSKELRNQVLSEGAAGSILSVSQLVAAYQKDPQAAGQRYAGKQIMVMGQGGGMAKAADGRLYLRLHNAFIPSQVLHCYVIADGSQALENLQSGSLLVKGTVDAYKYNTLELRDCTISLPYSGDF